MEKFQKITKIFILVALVSILGYDFYVFNVGGTEATISWVIFEWSYKYPLIPLFTGFILGHLFWQMKPNLQLHGCPMCDHCKKLKNGDQK